MNNDVEKQQAGAEHARADHLLELARYEEAIPVIGIQLAKAPDNAMLHYQMARAFLGLNDFNAADKHADTMISVDPNNPMGFYLKSLTSHALKNFVGELSYAEQAVILCPDDADFLKRLSQARLQNGLIAKARESAEQMMLLAPDEPESHEVMADICLALKDYYQAKVHVVKALEYSPNSYVLLNDLARCHIGLKDRKLAIDTMFNALQQLPDSETLRSNMFRTIQSFLDLERLKGRAALKSLPEELQFFYRDYQQRTNAFEKHGTLMWGVFWLILMGGLIAFFSTVT
ncbi:hypothetical protein HR060_06445 [Catenovulum sp. SM1970]|uniref:tetratricopeptide repeat protein n=1 Tax=Marinifaba aquimaris TaxID=2741323 RepID=UPI001572EA8B|nr:hypothetical protein [Marinifaba aquimaris]NTS76506.1 hypothetical protein [Marinifaba aquimaris]